MNINFSCEEKRRISWATAPQTDPKERSVFWSFCRCRFCTKRTDNHGLYGLCLHSVGSCSVCLLAVPNESKTRKSKCINERKQPQRPRLLSFYVFLFSLRIVSLAGRLGFLQVGHPNLSCQKPSRPEKRSRGSKLL